MTLTHSRGGVPALWQATTKSTNKASLPAYMLVSWWPGFTRCPMASALDTGQQPALAPARPQPGVLACQSCHGAYSTSADLAGTRCWTAPLGATTSAEAQEKV